VQESNLQRVVHYQLLRRRTHKVDPKNFSQIKQIRREPLDETPKTGHGMIYDNKLQRLWPVGEGNRKQKIARLANENGFTLTFHKQGLDRISEKVGGRFSKGEGVISLGPALRRVASRSRIPKSGNRC
jgi:hypothetical protein